MSIKKFHYLILLVIIIAIYSLFSIKNKVSTLDYQLSSVSKQINDETNNIHLLKAEKAYLIAPLRLKKLANAYLQLDTIKSSQMIKDPLASNNEQYVKFNQNINISTGSNKWRYKKTVNNKYVQTISSRVKP
ncbi:cell division protein FtsL [Rickettsia endosymbiont of Halotydeus destructor]|uniref:cell division protein FtsL n=1 Tax=Rickettsia endosymbiont of Halotydeus destructor TaxID=2996754 RepID=UPI003BB1D78E